MNYLDFDEAIAINKRILGESRVGILSKGSLEYCLSRARNSGGPIASEEALAIKASELLFCVVRNHPFLDGNKRTAYGLAYGLIISNGYALEGVETGEALNLLAGVAEGKGDIFAVRSFIRKHLRRAGGHLSP